METGYTFEVNFFNGEMKVAFKSPLEDGVMSAENKELEER